MAETYPSVTSLVDDASAAYTRRFGRAPSHVVYAPGRVNLIGEHTDYNDGFVLPMALPLVTVVVGGISVGGQCHVITTSSEADQPHDVTFPVPTPDDPLIPSPPVWSNYVKGVVANFKGSVSGFDAVMTSSVPLGSGLSSSAALEVAFYTFLEAMNKQPAASLEEKAKQCQLAEHLFAGVPCGIMDQLISVKASPDHALLIDCRSMETELVALTDPDVSVLIINSHVRHQLSGSEYPDRRAACHQAAAALHVPSLRDATLHALQESVVDLSDVQFRRARHVISEIERTQRAAAALKDADYTSFGQLMLESHKSLRDDFEVSCVECDQLVDLCSTVDGVFGSRMTGAGFGGCTVTLLRSDAVEPCIKHVKSNYRGKVSIYICRPSGGASIYSG